MTDRFSTPFFRNVRAKVSPAEVGSQELAEMLAPAVRGGHRPLTAKRFAQLRLRGRRKPVGYSKPCKKLAQP
jgi:hypothetical protein